jgi:hypothetical protein
LLVAKYIPGQSVRSTAEFRTIEKVLTDPTTVRFMLRTPAGTETTKTHGVDVEVVKISTGRYRCDFAVSTKGDYVTRWKGEGALVTAGEEIVEVDGSQFSTP